MKKITFLTAMLLVAFTICAQKVEWGVENKAESKWYEPTVLAEDGESVYTSYFDNENIVIEKHDKKGSTVFSNIIKLEKINDNKVELENIEFIKGNFILFVSSYNDSQEKATLYALTYSGSDGKKMGREKKLYDAPVEKKNLRGGYIIKLSNDKSKILINHFAFYKKEGKVKDRYKLFDSEFNDLMDKTEVFNKKEMDYVTSNYVIDNEGSVYFVKKMDSGESFIVSYDATKDYEKWEEEVDATKLDRSQSVGFVKFAFDNNNDLIIAGICSEMKKDSKGIFKKLNEKVNPVGALYMKIDRKSKEVKVMKISKFPIASSLKTDVYSFAQQSMHFTANNDLVFISQVFKIQYTNKMKIYYDGELIAAKFNSEGDLGWSALVPKMQVASEMIQLGIKIGPSFANIFYFGYISGVNNSKLFIVYNDNPKNLGLTDNEKVKPVTKAKGSIPMLCTIDLATGNKESKQFFNPEEAGTYIKTRVCFQKDYKSDIVSIAQHEGKYRVVRIKLNN